METVNLILPLTRQIPLIIETNCMFADFESFVYVTCFEAFDWVRSFHSDSSLWKQMNKLSLSQIMCGRLF